MYREHHARDQGTAGEKAVTAWPSVPLSEVLRQVADPSSVKIDEDYPNLGIYSYGRGLFKKSPIRGAESSAKTLYRVKRNHFIYSRLFAFEGAYGAVSDEYDSHFVSNEYPMFECVENRIDLRYLVRYFQRSETWREVAASATGMGHRRQRVQPDQFLKHSIPLPSIEEQRRVVSRIEMFATKLEAAEKAEAEVREQNQRLLEAAFCVITEGAPLHRLGEIAPLTRRPATIDPLQSYPGVSVRSFGRGTFHNPPQQGSELTWEKPHLVRAGDILISNIKAWEGAIAVAQPKDDGRYGSHRYLTYVPIPDVATARFICFFLLTSEGLHHVGKASPGSADRNRTTSAKSLLEIPVPLPNYQQQLWFGELFDKVETVQQLQAETMTERQVLLPAILNRSFNGGAE